MQDSIALLKVLIIVIVLYSISFQVLLVLILFAIEGVVDKLPKDFIVSIKK